MFAAIDIHKHAFQASVFDPGSGEVVEERFSADRESLGRWAGRWEGRVSAVAIEATTGWRWVGASSRRASSMFGSRNRCRRARCWGVGALRRRIVSTRVRWRG